MGEGIAVLCSGGGARVATQVPAIEHLARTGRVRRWCGTSGGAINTLGAAAQRVSAMRRIWERVRKPRDFQRLNLPDIWDGIWSLNPLERLLKKEGITEVISDHWVGTFDYATARHRMVHVNRLPPDQQVQAVLCSSAQPGIHENEDLGSEPLGDGGVASVLPACPGWEQFDEIHAIFAQPKLRLPRLTPNKLKSGIARAGRALDFIAHRIVVQDHARLRAWKRKAVKMGRNLRIFVYQPRNWEIVGEPFEISPALTAQRFEEGEWMKNHPIEVKL